MSQSDYSFNQRLFFDAVREVVGQEGVMALHRDLGGSEIFVTGDRVKEGSPIAKVLGFDAARKVVDKLRVIGADDRPAAGFRVYVGQGPFSIRHQTRAMARVALAAGMAPREAARHVGITERTMHKYVREYRNETGQADAFPPHYVRVGRSNDAALIAAHAEGPTLGEMVERLGIAPATLRKRLEKARKRTGLTLELRRPERRPRIATPPQPNRYTALVAAHAEGLTAPELAKRLGIPVATLYPKLAAARLATGLSLSVRRASRPARAPLREAERHAPLIAAHAAGPSVAEMTACLGIRPQRLRQWLAEARAETGRALPLCRSTTRISAPPRPLDGSSWADRKAQLIAAHAERMTPDTIAERFGWTVGYVYSQFWWVRQDTGLSLLFDRAPGQEKLWGEHIRARQAQVEAAFHEGLSSQQIADRLTVSVSTVKNYMNRLRRETGARLSFDMPRQHPHTRMGQDRRRIIAEAYAPGLTLDAIAARTGLTERIVQGHLVRLRRETGHDFVLRRRSGRLGNVPRPVNVVTGDRAPHPA